MSKEKACLNCKTIYYGDKCPRCSGTAFSDSFKGRVFIFNPQESVVAKKLKLKESGEFAIRIR